MAEQDIDWSKLPDDVREKLAELDLELSEVAITINRYNKDDENCFEVVDMVESEAANLQRMPKRNRYTRIKNPTDVLLAKLNNQGLPISNSNRVNPMFKTYDDIEEDLELTPGQRIIKQKNKLDVTIASLPIELKTANEEIIQLMSALQISHSKIMFSFQVQTCNL
ncbi:hypothetical protein RN001_009826 [Aquatica leii]|uniref:DMAP1-binding domain-containing protein n=1 Tax=Aquatica leii TaxID=1421715 RepID=A0AAN7SQ30_9COLE|nr:hypothetical protein RN001_009826 [Aquatica leii]